MPTEFAFLGFESIITHQLSTKLEEAGLIESEIRMALSLEEGKKNPQIRSGFANIQMIKISF